MIHPYRFSAGYAADMRSYYFRVEKDIRLVELNRLPKGYALSGWTEDCAIFVKSRKLNEAPQ